MLNAPEVSAILEQVAQEIAAMMAETSTGTVIIHVGRSDLHVEVERKRRHPSIRIERTPQQAR